MEFVVEPVERCADIVHFPGTMVVTSFAQPRPAKVEAQHREAKAVQRLHSVVNDLIVQGAPI